MAELILALDTPDRASAIGLLDRLPDVVWVKLGSVLFTEAGPALVTALKARGHRVFLDLKWHDIPNTVRGATRRASALGVDMVTVHALGGPAMMAAAKEGAGDAILVVAVTVLTSHSAEELSAILGRGAESESEVVRLARSAQGAGVDGVVASPREAATLRKLLGPKAAVVTPGIRAGTDTPDDQARTATARAAARAGASHLVIGRPVLEAPDPAIVWGRLLGEAQ
ncbi:MAG: orotidine-5'-phosphate decarboxylase [Gemmatimonadales bacterium]